MTDEERAEITALATDLHDKGRRYQEMGLANQPRDPVKAKEQSVAYEMAHAELIEAQNKLSAAKARLGREDRQQ